MHAPENIRVSVCMAAYRGEAYIKEQIDSILSELGQNDELIVVDDASGDGTVASVEAFSGDSRVRLVRNERNMGYVRTFDRAVGLARGEYIFLSDQDDVWMPGRLQRMLDALQESAVVATNFSILGEEDPGKRILLRSRDSRRNIRNIFAVIIGYRPYYGCGMAIRADALALFAPIPGYVFESHDLWLAITANASGQMTHLDEPGLYRRLHDNNVTPSTRRPLYKILRARVLAFRMLAEAIRRRRANPELARPVHF
ncbi:glycosyltransferase family 2 protein [Arthrobacter sp. zg-Y1143]|uniref:glycosyltransferase family 2 protein n=1 Tax=Arthrobacter sp. zg-Y1143 TaxID=3049065 RepID=UPI0024C2551E|nr:glycosyltransferase family 2 protein [Arthrobacter sp. zg-Y1143]MDK1327188.1 glycosyltransferase family 2 protein [Arthrobacter sp. zg-Y1143]